MIFFNIDETYDNFIRVIHEEMSKRLIFTHRQLRNQSSIHIHEKYFNEYFKEKTRTLSITLVFKLLDFFGYKVRIFSMSSHTDIDESTYRTYFKDVLLRYRRNYLYENNIITKSAYENFVGYYNDRRKTSRSFMPLDSFLTTVFKLDLQLLLFKVK